MPAPLFKPQERKPVQGWKKGLQPEESAWLVVDSFARMWQKLRNGLKGIGIESELEELKSGLVDSGEIKALLKIYPSMEAIDTEQVLTTISSLLYKQVLRGVRVFLSESMGIDATRNVFNAVGDALNKGAKPWRLLYPPQFAEMVKLAVGESIHPSNVYLYQSPAATINEGKTQIASDSSNGQSGGYLAVRILQIPEPIEFRVTCGMLTPELENREESFVFVADSTGDYDLSPLQRENLVTHIVSIACQPHPRELRAVFRITAPPGRMEIEE